MNLSMKKRKIRNQIIDWDYYCDVHVNECCYIAQYLLVIIHHISLVLYTHTHFLCPITIPSHIHHQQCCADLRQFLPISAPLRVTLDALVPLLSEVVAPFKRTARAQSAAFAADKVRWNTRRMVLNSVLTCVCVVQGCFGYVGIWRRTSTSQQCRHCQW